MNLYEWLYSQKSVNPDIPIKYFPSKWDLLQGLPKANLITKFVTILSKIDLSDFYVKNQPNFHRNQKSLEKLLVSQYLHKLLYKEKLN